MNLSGCLSSRSDAGTGIGNKVRELRAFERTDQRKGAGEIPAPKSVAAAGLWEGSAYEGTSAVGGARVADDEDGVSAGLEAVDDGAVGGLVGDGVLVDLGDDGPFGEADLIGEGAGGDVGDDDAALDAELGGDAGGYGSDLDAELVLSGVGLLGAVSVVIAVVGGDVGGELGAVPDGDVGRLLLAVAEITELDGGSDVAGGDVVDEVVAILDGASVDGDDDVLGLETGLGGAATFGVTTETMTPFLKPYTRPTAED